MADPKSMTVLELIEHERALSKTLPLLAPEAQETVKADLENTISTKSHLIDRVYAYLATHEDMLERDTKEIKLLTDSKKHHISEIDKTKRVLRYIGRMLPAGQNSISGNKYKFLLSKKSTSAVVVNSNIEDWTDKERNKFCIQKDIEIITKTVVRSLTGEIISQEETPKTKTEIIPNETAIRNANKNQEPLPEGVYVYQTIAVTPKRISIDSMEMETSDFTGKFLSETSSPTGS